MSEYIRRAWKNGEEITSEKLNNLEQGVTEAKMAAGQTAAHTHGNISNDGKIGSTADLAVFTGEGGKLTTCDPAAARQKLGVAETVQEVTATGTKPVSGAAVAIYTAQEVTTNGTQPVSGAAVASYVAQELGKITDYEGVKF